MQVDLGKGTVHPSHMKARLAYASRIIAFLDRHVPTAKAANLAAMSDATWHRVATTAGEVNMPSVATISTIVGMVHMREKMQAEIAKVTGAGFQLSTLETVDHEAALV